jgi:predicted permease
MWRRYLRFWRSDVERDVDDELRFHFESRVADLRARGMTAEEAQRQAAEEFGDEVAVRASLGAIGRRMQRRESRLQWWDAVRTDLRYTMRGLATNSMFTVAIVLTLAVGIGAATTMYDVMRRLLIQAPPGVVASQDVRRLFFMYESPGHPREASSSFSYGYLERVRVDAHTVTAAAYMPGKDVVVGEGSDAAQARATLVSAGFWRTLGVRPMLGRFISDDEAHPEHGRRVVVLGHGYWERRFGGDSMLVGRTITVQGNPYEVIGVAPRGFRGVDLTRSDIWLPLFAYGDGGRHLRWWEGSYNLSFVVRLLPGRTQAQAAQELTSLRLIADGEQARRFSDGFASRVKRMPVLLSGVTGALGYDAKRLPEATVSLWLVGVALILLGIALANVASLLLLRALRRQREIAVRLALGMTRRRLAALLLTESAVLAILGAGASVVVAVAGGQWVQQLMLSQMATERAGPDWPMFGFAAALTALTALVTGLAPMLQARGDQVTRVNDGSQHGSARRSPLHVSLLLAQTALAVMLLVGAGLFVRSLHRLETLDLGLNTRDVRTVEVHFEGTGRPGREITAFYEAALERVRELPGVERASLAIEAPLQDGRGAAIRFRGAEDWFRPEQGLLVNEVTDGFFETTEMRIVQGRAITATDRTGTPVAVVNQALARVGWPGRSPIGDCIYTSFAKDVCVEVVGVVANARSFSIREAEQMLWFYRPLAPNDIDSRVLLVRTRPGVSDVDAALQHTLRDIDPALPYIDVRPLGDVLDPQLRPWRLGATLFTAFGVLAMLLALLGLYAAVAYAVTQRTREIGVRMAVGATAGNVVRLILGDGVRIAVTGIVTGLALALIGGPFIADLLFDVSPRDPAVLASVGGGVLLAAMLASLLPARRAARVDPVTALRVE